MCVCVCECVRDRQRGGEASVCVYLLVCDQLSEGEREKHFRDKRESAQTRSS